MAPPGTEATTPMLKVLVAPATKELEANPAALVATTEVSPPVAKEAPPPTICGIVNATAMPATGTSFSSVTLTTACELTRFFFTLFAVLAPSTIVSLNFWGTSGPRAFCGCENPRLAIRTVKDNGDNLRIKYTLGSVSKRTPDS
jgi:hypothetical protein